MAGTADGIRARSCRRRVRSGTGSSLAACRTLAATAAGLAKSAGLRAFALLGVVQLGLAVIPAVARYAETRRHLVFRRELAW